MEGREQQKLIWVEVLGFVAAVAIIVGVVIFFLHPSVTYNGYNADASIGRQTSLCISPWNRWSGHYSLSPAELTPAQHADELLASAACKAVIDGREHVAWTAVVIGAATLAGAIVYRRRRLHSPATTRV